MHITYTYAMMFTRKCTCLHIDASIPADMHTLSTYTHKYTELPYALMSWHTVLRCNEGRALLTAPKLGNTTSFA